jgi:hypothetical protein
MLLGVLAFAVLLVAIIAVAGLNLAGVSDEAASPTETSIGQPLTGTEGAEGGLDSDAQPAEPAPAQ